MMDFSCHTQKGDTKMFVVQNFTMSTSWKIYLPKFGILKHPIERIPRTPCSAKPTLALGVWMRHFFSCSCILKTMDLCAQAALPADSWQHSAGFFHNSLAGSPVHQLQRCWLTSGRGITTCQSATHMMLFRRPPTWWVAAFWSFQSP